MPLLEEAKFGPKRRDEFRFWLQHQLQQTIADRSDKDREWENNIIQARARLPEGTNSWPFEGSANLEFPLTDIHFQPVLADLLQTLHSPENYWTPTAKRQDRVTHVNAMREGITALEKRFLKMRRVNTRAFQDMILLGTGIYKNRWHEKRLSHKDYAADGSIETVTRRLSQPRVEHVPLQKFYFPADSWSLDPDEQGGTQWQAQRFDLTEGKLREWAAGSESLPGFNKADVEKVLNWAVDEDKPLDEEIRQEENFQPFNDEKITVWEVYARFDIDGNGIEEDVVVVFHLETMTILRALHNPFMHGKWPFDAVPYLPGFGIYGRGLAEVDEWAQETLTKLLNAQLDNVLLSNTRMYAAPLGSNIQPGEPVYPGKIWFVQPGEEIGEIRMSDIYQSLPQVIGQIMQFSEMRTGVSEIRQGNLTGLPSRTPATSLLSILREGNKRFDMILTNLRDIHSEMGLRMLQNTAQHVRDDPLKWQAFFTEAIGPDDAGLVMEVLNSSVAEIEESFGISVTATSAQVNKEVEKQSFIGLMQIVSQIYGQLVQTAMLMSQAQDPLTQQTAQAAYSAGTELLKRLLERFDVQNPSEYLPNLQALQGAGAQMAGMPQGGAGAQQGQGGGLGVQGAAQGIPPQLLNQAQLGGLFGL